MAYQYKKSQQLYDYAQKVIPGGVQISRKPLIPGRSPIYNVRAKGCYCWDVDGNKYIDYCPAWGPLILGWCYKSVDEAAISMIKKGLLFTQNHPIQNKLAEKLIRLIPSAQMCTFMKTGSEVTSAAIRIARSHTGREKIARCGYHGWHDWCQAGDKGVGGRGIPKVLEEYTLAFDANQPQSLEKLFGEHPDQIAGVIIAPEGATEVISPDKKLFRKLKEITHKNGALFIFDEVKTFPRISLGGIQKWLGVMPDLTTISKALANGYPIGAIVGKKEVMMEVDRIWLSATFNGETMSMAAALKTLEEMERLNVVEHLWKMGKMLINGLNEIIREFNISAKAFGWPLPPMPFLKFTIEEENKCKEIRDNFFAEMIARGILLHPTHLWFISYSHKQNHIEKTLDVARKCMKIVQAKL